MAQPEPDESEGRSQTDASDERAWPSESERAEAPVAFDAVKAVFILDGTSYLLEIGEGVAYGQVIAAKSWHGPEPKYHPHPSSGDDEAGYGIATPTGEVRIAEEDVADIRTAESFIDDGK